DRGPSPCATWSSSACARPCRFLVRRGPARPPPSLGASPLRTVPVRSGGSVDESDRRGVSEGVRASKKPARGRAGDRYSKLTLTTGFFPEVTRMVRTTGSKAGWVKVQRCWPTGRLAAGKGVSPRSRDPHFTRAHGFTTKVCSPVSEAL